MMQIKGQNHKKNKLQKGVFVKLFLVSLLVIISLLGLYKASTAIKTKGYDGLADFIGSVFSNYWKGTKEVPENIFIEIKEKDLKKLEKNREQALERGVIINDLDGEYVPGTLQYKSEKIKIKLRLKGHMTDHLQDNKWSFRIKIQEKNSFMGMKRFSIQHPGTRGYIYEWIYHELMKREDIIALQYKFINVSVNGKDWGIYAVEENFSEELIANNNRKNGPIIRFNPDLYWIDRYNGMQQLQPVAEYASYYSSNPEAYREEDVLSDSTQHNYYLKALALMEGFRCKKITADQAFDIPRLATFHAIIDLVGGQHSIDWSDIKYYYNPVTARLEPVAYESFTVFPFESIAGNYKYVVTANMEQYKDLHTALFSSPVFFKSYVKELERITNPAYLDTFFSEVDSALKSNLAILYKEFPYKKFDPEGYYLNQRMIRKILDAPTSFHAYLNHVSADSICLQLGAIESLPVAIKSVSIGNVEVYPSHPVILPAKQHNEYVSYTKYYFSLPKGCILNDAQLTNMKVNYSLLGSEKLKQERVFLFPHTDDENLAAILKNKQSTINNFLFLSIDEKQKVIVFKPGNHILTTDLIIPAGYKVIANEGVSIDLKNRSKIISYAPVHFSGTEELPVVIHSSDSTGGGFVLLTTVEKSVFKHMVVKKFRSITDEQWKRSGIITCYESPVEFIQCDFYELKAKDAIQVIRSDFSVIDCNFIGVPHKALSLDFSKGLISGCTFTACGTAMEASASSVELKTLLITGSANKALQLKEGSQLRGMNVTIKTSHIAIAAEDMVDISIRAVIISNCDVGLMTRKKNSSSLPVVNITGTLDQTKRNYVLQKNSTVHVNGQLIATETSADSAIKIENDRKESY
jgi:hypothetical protein